MNAPSKPVDLTDVELDRIIRASRRTIGVSAEVANRSLCRQAIGADRALNWRQQQWIPTAEDLTLKPPAMTLHEWYVGQAITGILSNTELLKSIELDGTAALRSDVLAAMADNVAEGLMRRRALRNAGTLPPNDRRLP